MLCLLALLLATLACSSEQVVTEAPAQPAQTMSPVGPAVEAGATSTANTVFLPEVGAERSTASPVENHQANPHVEIEASLPLKGWRAGDHHGHSGGYRPALLFPVRPG
jgi:hypothetical protein